MAALVVVGGLVLGACGYDPPEQTAPTGEQALVVPAPSPTTTTTTVPPGGRVPTPEDPLRVLLAGDSVMADLAPAAIDALNRGGATEARFGASPGLVLEPTAEAVWRQQLESFDPEVVVVLVGTWEIGDRLGTPGSEQWRARYDAEVLDPFVELVTSQGAEVIWVGMPAVEEPDSTLVLVELNSAYEDLEDRFPGVRYVPGGEYVSSPEGGYTDVLEGPDGPERVRRVDGLHLCPGGAVRLAQPVLDLIEARWAVPVAEDWTTGEWREPPLLQEPEECPAP